MEGKYWVMIAGICAAGVGIVYVGLSDINKQTRAAEIEIAKAHACEMKIQDLNNNGLPETFCERDGLKFFLEIDGQNLETKLKR